MVIFFIFRSIFQDLPGMVSRSMGGDKVVKKAQNTVKTEEIPVSITESPVNTGNVRPPIQPILKDSVIFVYCKDYIITDSGRVNLGETFIKDGKKQILSGVDIVYKSVICSPVPDGVQAVSGEGIAETGRNELQENSGG